jgi:RHS repeat-associated protein
VAWSYDARRRVEAETRGIVETTTYGYDGNGNRTSMERPEGGVWLYEYDGANRLTAVVNPELDRTEYTYDLNGNLETHTDGELNTTSFEYDELNRRSLLTYPDGAFKAWAYDPEGNLVDEQDAKGQVTTYSYDALGRETRREYREGRETPDFAQAVSSSWDANNNLLTVVESAPGEADQTTTHTYDSFDRMESVTDRWGNRLRYAYDANGNRTQLTDPNEKITTYTYDELNRVSSVLIPGAGTTSYEYFKNGLLKNVSYPNGTTAEYIYDASNRVETIDNRHNVTALVSSFEYAYDRNGNRLQQIETHGGDPSETTVYEYDAADRLLVVTYPDKITSYTYDGAGNRLTEAATDLVGETVLSDKVYVYNSRNQLAEQADLLDQAGAIAYSYDLNGNRASRITGNDEFTDFTFDIRDRLVALDRDGTRVGTYAYDFRDLRISKQSEEFGLQQYIYDDQSVLLRMSVGRVTKYNYGPRQLLSVDDTDEGRGYYLFDALGSISELTTPSGTVMGRYLWDAWGNKRSSVENGASSFGFTGHEHDAESGLVYAKARFYDPEVGLFLSSDLAEGDRSLPPSLHRYLYAFQNPTVYVDLDGRFPTLKNIGYFAGGLVAGAAVGIAVVGAATVFPVAVATAVVGIAANASVNRYKEALDDSTDASVLSAVAMGTNDAVGLTAAAEIIEGLEIGTGRTLTDEERAFAGGSLAGAIVGGFTAYRAIHGLGEAIAEGAASGFRQGATELFTGRVGPAALEAAATAEVVARSSMAGAASSGLLAENPKSPVVHSVRGRVLEALAESRRAREARRVAIERSALRARVLEALAENRRVREARRVARRRVLVAADDAGDASNRILHEQYLNGLRAAMERPHVQNAALSRIMDDLYRPGSAVGSGSTAAAVRHEAATGRPVGGRFHTQKAQDSVIRLQRWLSRNPTASHGDRAAAENVLRDLQNALEGN